VAAIDDADDSLRPRGQPVIEAKSRHTHAPAAAYATTRFASAPPIRQRIALLDGAVAAALSTASAIERHSLEEAHEQASLCRGMLLELAFMIRGDSMPQLALAMSGLTVYLHGLMVQSMTERSPEPARRVARLLQCEREAWVDRLREPGALGMICQRTDAVA